MKKEKLENMEFDELIIQDGKGNWEGAKELACGVLGTFVTLTTLYAASYALEKILEIPCKVLYQLGN